VVGQGGTGTVYEAEQEKPRRVVALKMIKLGFVATESLLRRFEQESQVLARLQHPGIAQVYEAGTADAGHGVQPYFAMEFVRGRTLDEHAEGKKLGTRERLDLLARVCDAVEHAHQKGIIHRDLKPGNILVDGSGQPKILDFGLARVTDSDVQLTMHTDVAQIVGTLPYMSPEQVGGDPAELDTRSDVYALGVILYQLLAGRLPHDVRKRQLTEGVRIIREEEPSRLSMVNRMFRGDIETIAAKALSKEKERRYQSAADLASDIRRYLKDEPIVARPPTAAYQLRKFARRNRVLVAGVAATFVVLVVGVVVSSWQAVRATRAEGSPLHVSTRRSRRGRWRSASSRIRRARRLAEAPHGSGDAEGRGGAGAGRGGGAAPRGRGERPLGQERGGESRAVNAFLQSMLSSVDPSRMKGRDVTVRQVLDEAAKKVADESVGPAEIEAPCAPLSAGPIRPSASTPRPSRTWQALETREVLGRTPGRGREPACPVLVAPGPGDCQADAVPRVAGDPAQGSGRAGRGHEPGQPRVVARSPWRPGGAEPLFRGRLHSAQGSGSSTRTWPRA
jgi:predicted Ser/Thr protein kinase